jgi:hypothetical protein
MMAAAVAQAHSIVSRSRAQAPAAFDPRNEAASAFDDAAAAVQKIRDGFSRFTVTLNAMTLPDALKPAVNTLVSEVNALMTKMPPLQAHKAGQDATYAINSLNDAIGRCQEAMDGAMRMCSEMSKNCMSAMNAKELSVNGLVTSGIETEITNRISEGKLFDKATVDGLVATARGQGKELALNGLTLLNNRKKAVTDAKLPLPESDAVLEGDDAAFNTLTANVKNRLDTLAKNGLTVSRAPDLVKRLVWASDFDLQLKNALDVLKVGAASAGGGGTGGNGGARTSGGHRLVV